MTPLQTLSVLFLLSHTATSGMKSVPVESLAEASTASVARLEMVRAQAAFDGGAAVKLQRYERQSDKYDKRLERETSELHDLEIRHGTKLGSFGSPPATAAPALEP